MKPNNVPLRRPKSGAAFERGKSVTSPNVLRAEPLYDQIYEILWQKILNLEIKAGAGIRDVEWAEKLNVSRTPVREALRKMQKDGIVLALSNGRYVLRQINSEELRALYRCRAALESLAVRDLAGRVPFKDLTKLQTLVTETASYLEKRDFHVVFRLHTEFHERLTGMSENTFLLSLLENLRRLILYARSTLRTLVLDEGSEFGEIYAEQIERSQTHHAKILAAIAVDDFELAAKQMETHLFETAEDMCAIFDKATDAAALSDPTALAPKTPSRGDSAA